MRTLRKLPGPRWKERGHVSPHAPTRNDDHYLTVNVSCDGSVIRRLVLILSLIFNK